MILSYERRGCNTVSSLWEIESSKLFDQLTEINSSSFEYPNNERQRLLFLLDLLLLSSPPTTDHLTECCGASGLIQNELASYIELCVIGWSILIPFVKPDKLTQLPLEKYFQMVLLRTLESQRSKSFLWLHVCKC